MQSNRLTEAHDNLHHEEDDAARDEELLKFRIEPNHEVEDTEEDERRNDEGRQLGQLAGEEVGVDAVHPLEVLAEKNGQLCAIHLRFSKGEIQEELRTGLNGIIDR